MLNLTLGDIASTHGFEVKFLWQSLPTILGALPEKARVSLASSTF